MHGQHRRGGTLRLAAIATVAAAAWSGTAKSQPAVTRVLLADGVVVDATRGIAYVMSPNASVAAIGLDRGDTLWASKEAARPLALAGTLLVAQAEPSADRPRTLRVVTLDTSRRGETKVKGSIDLPDEVQAPVAETLTSSFTATADLRAGEVIIIWKHAARSVKGIAPRAEEVSTGEAPLALPRGRVPPIKGGSVRMNLTTGALTPLAYGAEAAAEPRGPTLDTPPPNERVKDAPGAQFLSSDRGHVLVSQRVADDRVWDKYRLTVYERATGRRIGEIRSHVSAAPFLVRDGLLVFATRPVARGEGGEQPPKLRAFDLGSGKEAWSVELRDTEYRGPFPP